MVILGIDPGSIKTGYGVVEKTSKGIHHVDNGVIIPRAKKDFPGRLHEIYDGLIEMFQRFKPEEVAIEEVFFAANVRSALKLGEARGVALLAARQQALPIAEYSARAIKMAITGYGNADKVQMQKMVCQLLKLPQVAAEDASDALAVALCHAHSRKIKQL